MPHIDYSATISQRVRAGERPSVVLRDLLDASPDLRKHKLGRPFAAAFPECGSWLIHLVWNWREQDHLDFWDEWFDLQAIEDLRSAGVQLPWNEQFCEAERARLVPLVDEANRVAQQAAMDAVSLDNLKAKVDALAGQVVCIEALWDGDTNGWFIRMSAIVRYQGELSEAFLGCISHGGDMRLFNGQVPPWPEAVHALELGGELARHYGSAFYFPSPDEPDDQQPSWLESKA